MVSLVDIVPQKRKVELAAGELELRGLGLRQIADLLLRFPNLRNLAGEGIQGISIERLLIIAPDAIGAIIAEAASQPEAADAIADNMPVDDVTECLGVIGELTMPHGVSPFWAKIEQFANDLTARGRALDMNVPKQPSNSSLSDTSLVQ